jgi:acetyl-CoA carboxylase carboxyl transferase subunit beta
MAWFSKIKTNVEKPAADTKRAKVPEGLWTKCKSCAEIVYQQEIERNLMVCPKCSHHFYLPARSRIALLSDEGSFVEHWADLVAEDPLEFKDSKKYPDRIKASQKSSGANDAMIAGRSTLEGKPYWIGCFEFTFMGGSMGSVVGEKVTRVFEEAAAEKTPAVIVNSSGGARMQEGLLSLMQMAKTSAALARLRAERRPYISILTDPTTGGVAASFAMLGDVIIAEPYALIGFAGPRVIEQTIRQKLPEGFQRSEFLLEHGMVDMIVDRHDLKATLARLLYLLRPGDRATGA